MKFASFVRMVKTMNHHHYASNEEAQHKNCAKCYNRMKFVTMVPLWGNESELALEASQQMNLVTTVTHFQFLLVFDLRFCGKNPLKDKQNKRSTISFHIMLNQINQTKLHQIIQEFQVAMVTKGYLLCSLCKILHVCDSWVTISWYGKLYCYSINHLHFYHIFCHTFA